MLKSDALQILHGNKSPPLLLADVIDRAYVGMVQGRCGLRFALEARQGCRIARQFGGKKLQRHETMKPGVLRFIDDTHSAAAQLFEDAVMRNEFRVHVTLVVDEC